MPLPLSAPVRGSDRAYAQIRDRIVDLRLPPGTAINEQAVAAELGLGRMPVREGLARLAHERFVTVVPRRGTRVAPVGVQDLVDLFEAREVLECGVAHLAAARATPADLRRLERLVARSDRPGGRRSCDELLCADHEVHTALLRVVGNAVLQDAGERLLLHSLRVGRAYAVDGPDVTHADLLAALLARDPERAAAAMREHVRTTHRQLRGGAAFVTRVVDVLAVPGRTGFFTDDQAAIRAGAPHDGFGYAGPPLTPGFTRVRDPGEAVSVLLVLDDGQVAHGDCAAVQYSGVGGRDPVFRAADGVASVLADVAPLLRGREVTGFREVAAAVEDLRVDGRPLHTAVRYGVSQALLDAAALAQHRTMAEVVRDEYATGVELALVPLFVQSGDERYDSVDKMVLKGAGALPHGLVNSAEVVGPGGERLAAYVRWVRDRVLALRADDTYAPLLHLDVYGTVGAAFGGDTLRVADYLARLGEVAAPFDLRVEQPVDAGSTPAQVEAMAALRSALRALGSPVRIAVDEWCNTLADVELFVAAQATDVVHVKSPDLGGIGNTVEALLHVRGTGVDAYCGGTANETDRSAQVCAHVAMACGAAQVLARPGMGVDEGMMVVGNEMARTLALAGLRR